jgi:hypothetical protein
MVPGLSYGLVRRKGHVGQPAVLDKSPLENNRNTESYTMVNESLFEVEKIE